MSSWFNKFWRKQDNTAQVAKDRLHVIVARERAACMSGTPCPVLLPIHPRTNARL